MVSTRRSRSAGGESEQAAPVNCSQDDVCSKHRVLQPITEEAEPNQQQQQQSAATPRGRSSRRAAASQQQQQLQEQLSMQGQQQPQQQDQEEPAQQQQQQQQHDGGGASISDDEDSDDDAGLDFDGDSVLQNLAAAIRSGFQSQKPQQPQLQQSRTGLQAAAAAAAAAAKKSSSSGVRELDNAALQQLRWRPHTGLQMPARAAAAVAITKPRQKKRQQDDDEQPAGAAAAAIGPQQPDPAAAAAAASKQPGLAKALHAPTLDAAARSKEAKMSAPDTAGSKWFDLPAPKITEDLKRDLRLLRLRGAYDPKRFYKSFDNTKFPKYFAVGTVVDDPLEQNNLSKGQRRATLTEQLLVDPELTTTRKRRFNKLQDDAKKWAKVKKRKTSQPRKNPSKHRPKH